MVEPATAIFPDWQVPDHVHALVTLRSGGYSKNVYKGFNLASHVGDNPELVLQNREHLFTQFNLPAQPCWLNQTHSTDIVELPVNNSGVVSDADAAWTNKQNTVCAVLTADCLPIFFFDPLENTVAVTHAGWRGLANGIIEKTVIAMTRAPEQLQVWLGPAIGAEKFEVGAEVKKIFCQNDPQAAECFKQFKNTGQTQSFLADIYRLAKGRLYNAGVISITGGDYCTVSDEQQFFSYRRDGATGRMANLIWLTEH